VGGYFTPNTVLVPRRILDYVGLFDLELGGNADWDLWLRIAAAGHPARYVDERLAYYRIHSQNMSRDSAHMRETRLRTLRKLLRAFPDVVAESLEELRQAAEEAAGMNAWIQSLEEAKAWHEQQAKGWREAKVWHEQQAKGWQEAKVWHEQQARSWQSEAERLAAQLRRVPAPLRWWLERERP
jgi:hypothetical protein